MMRRGGLSVIQKRTMVLALLLLLATRALAQDDPLGDEMGDQDAPATSEPVAPSVDETSAAADDGATEPVVPSPEDTAAQGAASGTLSTDSASVDSSADVLYAEHRCREVRRHGRRLADRLGDRQLAHPSDAFDAGWRPRSRRTACDRGPKLRLPADAPPTRRCRIARHNRGARQQLRRRRRHELARAAPAADVDSRSTVGASYPRRTSARAARTTSTPTSCRFS